MTSPTKAPPHLRTSRGLPACTKHPTDGGCNRRSSGRSRSYLQSKTCDQFVRPLPSEGKGHTFESCRVRQQNQAHLDFRVNPILDRVSIGKQLPRFRCGDGRDVPFGKEESTQWLSKGTILSAMFMVMLTLCIGC